MSHEAKSAPSEDRKPVVYAMVVITILFFAWLLWPLVTDTVHNSDERMDDAYFYNLANQAQAYYHVQTETLGWNMSKELSKTCGRVIAGGPAFGESDELRCQINVAIDNTDPQTTTSNNELTARLRTTLVKEGFRVSIPARIPPDNIATPLLLGVAQDGCNATLDSVSDPGFVTPTLEYSLNCGGDVARDVPQGFSYNKTPQVN